MVDNSDKLFTGVRNCYVVMLAFASFLGKILGKGIIPITDKFCSVKKCVA